jgi:hypothetical protein
MTRSSIILDDENYLGLGGFWPGGSVVYPLFMKFNDTGNNYGYRIMNPEIIDSITISGGFEYGLLCDSVFIFSGDFEVIPGDEYQIAEVIMDTSIISSSRIIYNHILHPHTQYPHMLNKTSDHKILSVMTYENTDYKSDIYLSKMNMELETDSIYTGNYTYDSLCTGGIQSGTMTLDDCEIYTGMDDFPTPQKHYASLATIPIAIYPNPAGSELTITLQNTAYNSDITLTCFDITGRKVYALEVQKGQYEMQLDITRWSPGLYMAVVTSQGRVAGEKRFVVMK